MEKKKIKFLKVKNNFIPYRKFKEIFNENEIYDIFKDDLYYNDDIWDDLNLQLSKRLFRKYKERYPYEQDKEQLKYNLQLIKETYFDTYINNMIRYITQDNINKETLKEIMNKGAINKYKTKSGTSANPYNLAFDDVSGIIENDNLMYKGLSETEQIVSNSDVIKRAIEINKGKLTGEINNFVNSFYSLFSQINIDQYIESSLKVCLDFYKDIINMNIDTYNKLIKKLKEIKSGR